LPILGDAPVAMPLVSGRLRFARLKPLFAETRLSPYVPVAHRDEN